MTLMLLSIVTFLATNAIHGSAALSALGKTATPQQLAAFSQQQGLDRPVLERYLYWLGQFVTGHWGTSITSQVPVRQEVIPRMVRTVELAFAAFALAIPLGIGLGLASGRRAGRLTDRTITSISLVLIALPEFIVGLTLLAIFGVALHWFPVESGAIAFGGASLATTAEAFALPVITLALTVIPYVLRMMRANTISVTEEPYVRAAMLKGVRNSRLSVRHVMPNALVPVVNVLALNLAYLMAGVVVVETVFAFPGAGQLLVNSIESKDAPTVQAIVLLIGGFFVACNLVADVALIVLNPRLRTER
jgi:peptide/nickel transport system permease protein